MTKVVEDHVFLFRGVSAIHRDVDPGEISRGVRGQKNNNPFEGELIQNIHRHALFISTPVFLLGGIFLSGGDIFPELVQQFPASIE